MRGGGGSWPPLLSPLEVAMTSLVDFSASLVVGEHPTNLDGVLLALCLDAKRTGRVHTRRLQQKPVEGRGLIEAAIEERLEGGNPCERGNRRRRQWRNSTGQLSLSCRWANGNATRNAPPQHQNACGTGGIKARTTRLMTILPARERQGAPNRRGCHSPQACQRPHQPFG